MSLNSRSLPADSDVEGFLYSGFVEESAVEYRSCGWPKQVQRTFVCTHTWEDLEVFRLTCIATLPPYVHIVLKTIASCLWIDEMSQHVYIVV